MIDILKPMQKTQIIDAMKANSLVIFVGSGVSRSLSNSSNITVGLWPELVEELLDVLEKEDAQASVLRPLLKTYKNNPMSILGLIEKYPNFEKYERKICTALKKHYNIKDDNDLSVQQDLWELSDLIITTNFDNALELAYHIKNGCELTDIALITSDDYTTIVKNNSGLFKLHGSIVQESTMVVFPFQYEYLYGNNERDNNRWFLGYEKRNVSNFLELFKHMAHCKTFLFIGYSMGDMQIEYIFRVISDCFGRFGRYPKNFIVTKDALRNNLERFLDPIIINDFNTDIPKLLTELKDLKNITEAKEKFERNLIKNRTKISVTLDRTPDMKYIWRKEIRVAYGFRNEQVDMIPVNVWSPVELKGVPNEEIDFSFDSITKRNFDIVVKDHKNRTSPYAVLNINLIPKKKLDIDREVSYTFKASTKYFNAIYYSDIEKTQYYYSDSGIEYACTDGYYVDYDMNNLEIALRFDKSYNISIDKIIPYITRDDIKQSLNEKKNEEEMERIKCNIRTENDKQYNIIKYTIRNPKRGYHYGFLWNPICDI